MVSTKVNIETTNRDSSKNLLSASPSLWKHFLISTMKEMAVYSAALDNNDWNAVPNMKYSLISLYPHLEFFDKPSGNLC